MAEQIFFSTKYFLKTTVMQNFYPFIFPPHGMALTPTNQSHTSQSNQKPSLTNHQRETTPKTIYFKELPISTKDTNFVKLTKSSQLCFPFTHCFQIRF
jgi:hypothetical protein